MTEAQSWLHAPYMAANLSRQLHHADEAHPLLAPWGDANDGAGRVIALRDAMFRGQKVNASEDRAAGHWALRYSSGAAIADAGVWPSGSFAPEGVDLMPRMRAAHDHSRRIANDIRNGLRLSSTGRPYANVVHLGIGGSDIGPKLLIDSLGFFCVNASIAPVFISNLDYHAVQHALMRLDPGATLVVVASKSFTTQETMHNAAHLLRWMENAGIKDPQHNFIAVTSRTERAHDWGIPAANMLWFDDSIGGRFSLWGPVSITARIALGNDAIDAFIDGGLRMDAHFLSTALNKNLPAMMAAIDFHNLRERGLPTLMVSAYDSRLGLLVPYLKQLWMESLGKRVDREGRPLSEPACPILWGDIGTDAQHAFFQLLHQGTQGVAIELIGVCTPEHGAIDSHHALLANLIAQAQALHQGHDDSNAAKSCRGGHPVSLLMLDRFDAQTLGALIALWEHRVLCMAALADINPFDQWGVELGKSIAPSAFEALSTSATATAMGRDTPLDAISRAMIAWLRSRQG